MNAATKPQIYQLDIDQAVELFNHMPTDPPPDSIVEWIEDTRIMPSSSPFPGLVDLRWSPWAREWMENMSPYSLCQIQAILKASQTSATFAATNVIGYWMGANPTAIVYYSATEKLLEKWATKRLEPMIDSCGIRELIVENAENTFKKSSRRTGDKMFQKLVIGGSLEMGTLFAPTSARSESYRVGIIDETDGTKKLTSTGEGVMVDLIVKNRFKQWGDRKKVMILSTPTTDEESVIKIYYEDGDQRHFMIPCPCCGKFQYLYPFPDQDNHGLRADTKAGKIEQMYYICDFCHDAFFETSKYKFNNSGKWEPTANSINHDIYRSYYINTLYAAANTVNWKEYYTEYQAAKDDPEKMRSFTNNMAGLPYREEGSRPLKEKIIKLRGGYRSGEIQPGVLFLTIGADMQKGEKEFWNYSNTEIKEHLKNPENKKDITRVPRVELEVLGVGAGYRSWSIEYKIFPGQIDDPASGAWEDLYNWIVVPDQRTYTRADGHEFTPEIMLVDSGDGNYSDVVYDFCGRFPRGVYPSKGYGEIQRRKNEAAGRPGALRDAMSDFNYLRYRKSDLPGGVTLYTVSTNYYKNQIYNCLNVSRVDGKIQRPRFCDFPRDYKEAYFNQLRSEDQLRDGSFDAGKRRNEALDCRTYATCGGDIWLDGLVEHYRNQARLAGATREESYKIDKIVILDKYKYETGNEDYYKNDKSG